MAVADLQEWLGSRVAVVDTEFIGFTVFDCAIIGVDGDQEPKRWFFDIESPDPHKTDGSGTFGEHAQDVARHLDFYRILLGWNIANDKNNLSKAFAYYETSHGRMCWVDLAGVFYRLHREVGIKPVGRCKLSEAAEYYGIYVDSSKLHDAVYDAELTLKVACFVAEEMLLEPAHLRRWEFSGWDGPGWAHRHQHLSPSKDRRCPGLMPSPRGRVIRSRISPETEE